MQKWPENKTCADCSASEVQWASVTYATFLCAGCAGRHRGLGVRTSFVRSLHMDTWTEAQVKRMMLGGNKRFREYLKSVKMSRAPPAAFRTKPLQVYRSILDSLCVAAGFGDGRGSEAKGIHESEGGIGQDLHGSARSAISDGGPEDERAFAAEGGILVKEAGGGVLKSAYDLNKQLTTFSKAATQALPSSLPAPRSQLKTRRPRKVTTSRDGSRRSRRRRSRSASATRGQGGEGSPAGGTVYTATGNLHLNPVGADAPALCILYSSSAGISSRSRFRKMKAALKLARYWHIFVDAAAPENNGIRARLIAVSSRVWYPQLFIRGQDKSFQFVGGFEDIESLRSSRNLKAVLVPCAIGRGGGAARNSISSALGSKKRKKKTKKKQRDAPVSPAERGLFISTEEGRPSTQPSTPVAQNNAAAKPGESVFSFGIADDAKVRGATLASSRAPSVRRGIVHSRARSSTAAVPPQELAEFAARAAATARRSKRGSLIIGTVAVKQESERPSERPSESEDNSVVAGVSAAVPTPATGNVSVAPTAGGQDAAATVAKESSEKKSRPSTPIPTPVEPATVVAVPGPLDSAATPAATNDTAEAAPETVVESKRESISENADLAGPSQPEPASAEQSKRVSAVPVSIESSEPDAAKRPPKVNIEKCEPDAAKTPPKINIEKSEPDAAKTPPKIKVASESALPSQAALYQRLNGHNAIAMRLSRLSSSMGLGGPGGQDPDAHLRRLQQSRQRAHDEQKALLERLSLGKRTSKKAQVKVKQKSESKKRTTKKKKSAKRGSVTRKRPTKNKKKGGSRVPKSRKQESEQKAKKKTPLAIDATVSASRSPARSPLPRGLSETTAGSTRSLAAVASDVGSDREQVPVTESGPSLRAQLAARQRKKRVNIGLRVPSPRGSARRMPSGPGSVTPSHRDSVSTEDDLASRGADGLAEYELGVNSVTGAQYMDV